MVIDVLLRVNNLYRNASIIEFDNGEMMLIRDDLDIQPTLKDEYHTVLEGDEITKLAYDKYNRFVEDASKYWWVIAIANDIENPMDLVDLVGTEILIPNILDLLLKIE